MPNDKHRPRQSPQDDYIQDWLTGLHERTAHWGLDEQSRGPTGSRSKIGSWQRQVVHEDGFTKNLAGKNRRPLDTVENHFSGIDEKKPTQSDRIGLQAASHNVPLQGGKGGTSARLQPHQDRRRRGRSDSSVLDIGSRSSGSVDGRSERQRVDIGGTAPLGGVLQRDVEDSARLSPHQDSSEPRAQQMMFEKRARHKTRHDRYDPKPHKQKAEKGSKSKAAPVPARRGREKAGDALHRSFASGNITKGRLTLNPSSRVGLFKKGRASSPAEKRGLPDLAFSEMQFLHNWKKRANNMPKERSDEWKRCKRDKDIEFHEKISSYFSSAQDAFKVCNVIGGSCADEEVEDHIQTPDPDDRGSCSVSDRSSRCYRRRGIVGYALSLPAGAEDHHRGAYTTLKPTSATAVRSNQETPTETTSELSWSLSATPSAVVDASPKGLPSGSRTPPNGTPSKVSNGADEPDTREFLDYFADTQGADDSKGDQQQECAPCKRTETARVKCLRGLAQGEEVVDFLIGKGSKEVEQSIPDSYAILELTTPAGPRVSRKEIANSERRVPDYGKLGTAGTTKNQLAPPRNIYLHDRGTSPGVFTYQNTANLTVKASTSGVAHVAGCAESRVRAAGRCKLLVESDLDLGTNEVAARVQPFGDNSATAKIVLPQNATDASLTRRIQTVSSGELADYCTRKPVRFSECRLEENRHTTGQLWLPSPYASLAIHNDRHAASNPWNNGDTVLGSFFNRSPEKEALTVVTYKNEGSSLTGIRGQSVADTDLDDSDDFEALERYPALGLGDTDMGGLACHRHGRHINNNYVESGISFSLEDIEESGTLLVVDRCLDDIGANSDHLGISAPTYGDRTNRSSQNSPVRRRFLEDDFLNVPDSNCSQAQGVLSGRGVRTEDTRHFQLLNNNCRSMADFWRPHRLY